MRLEFFIFPIVQYFICYAYHKWKQPSLSKQERVIAHYRFYFGFRGQVYHGGQMSFLEKAEQFIKEHF